MSYTHTSHKDLALCPQNSSSTCCVVSLSLGSYEIVVSKAQCPHSVSLSSHVASHCPGQALIMVHTGIRAVSHLLSKSKLSLMNRKIFPEGSMCIQFCLFLLKIEP